MAGGGAGVRMRTPSAPVRLVGQKSPAVIFLVLMRTAPPAVIRMFLRFFRLCSGAQLKQFAGEEPHMRFLDHSVSH